MDRTKIEVGYSIIINLGNYQSAKIHMGKERPLDKDEDYEDALSHEFDHLVTEVERKREKILKLQKRKREVSED